MKNSTSKTNSRLYRRLVGELRQIKKCKNSGDMNELCGIEINPTDDMMIWIAQIKGPENSPFENGIYDLKHNLFREGRPEDYITLSTKIILPINRKSHFSLSPKRFVLHSHLPRTIRFSRKGWHIRSLKKTRLAQITFLAFTQKGFF